jgi:hypothetical protein
MEKRQEEELWNFIVDNPREYEKWIRQNMKDFVQLFIWTSKNPERDYNWLLNWIGKDCYEAFIGKKNKPECQKRKAFLESKYKSKGESKPFYSGQESTNELLNKKIPFISRLSSTVPGDITIQWIDETKSPRARRFNYETQKSDSGQNIQDLIDEILKTKNLVEVDEYKNYYDVPQPYEMQDI